jgi:hypothetical protein
MPRAETCWIRAQSSLALICGQISRSAKVVILQIDGAATGSLDALKAILLKGTPSSIKVWRKGAAVTLTVAQSL